MTKLQFTLAAILITAGVAVGGFVMFRPPPACDQAEASPAVDGTDDVDATIEVKAEVGGNTETWQDEIGGLVRTALDEAPVTHDEHPAVVAVELALFADGEPVTVDAGCGSDSFRLGPDAAVLDEWKAADTTHRATLEGDVASLRERQVDAIVRTVVEQVAATGSGEDGAGTTLSPKPLLEAVEPPAGEASRTVWILTAGASTSDDCLDPGPRRDDLDTADLDAEIPVLALTLVDDCLTFGQMEPVRTGQLHLVAARAANPSGLQKSWANALNAALCARAMAEGTTCTSVPI